MPTCADCGADFTIPAGRVGRPRKRCYACSPAQVGKPIKPRPKPDLSCVQCGNAFIGARAGMKFCSPRCKSYAGYRKRESDPVLRMKDRARQRARYVKALVRSECCSTCGESFDTAQPNRTYCSADCRNRARNDRRRHADSPARRDLLLNGVVIQHGAMAPTVRVLKCVQTIGLMVECPLCEVSMGALSPSLRVCAFCATEARLNDEEVESVHLVA